MSKQNKRNTAAARRSLLRSRKDRAAALADSRWQGASKILKLLARGAAIVTGARANDRLSQIYPL